MKRTFGLAELHVRHRWLRWTVLALGVAGAFSGAYLAHLEIEQEASRTFEAKASQKIGEVELRIRAYTDVLYALRGLFDASERVTRDDFHAFAEALAVRERYPGLLNTSYSALVPHERKQAFEAAVRAETSELIRGLPAFAVKPPGERPEYVVLHYMEPIAPNVAAWGLDLLSSDPGRRSVIERARDTGLVTASSSITLVRDSSPVPTSMLLRLAVYRGGGVPKSVPERRQLLTGVVGSALRISDLIETALSRETLTQMRVRIFAGGTGAASDANTPEATLLYDSHGRNTLSSSVAYSAYTVSRGLAVGDREWRLMLTPLANPAEALDRVIIPGVFGGLLALTGLLFWLMSSLAAVQSRRLELATRNREMAELTSLGDDLHSCGTLEEAHDVIAKRIPDLLPGTAGVLYALDAAHLRGRAAARWHMAGPVVEDIATGDCQSLRRGRLYHVEHQARALNCAHFSDGAPECYVCVPLNAHGEVIGMLHLQPRQDADTNMTCGESAINLIKAAAQHVALALANLELREGLVERATRDSLTQLYNRHYMREWLEGELHRAARSGRTIGLILLDLDHFKRLNDTFGHEAGDMALRAVADAIRSMARSSDVACRYGGEEFLLLLPEATLEATIDKAERLRREIARLALGHEGKKLGGLTASAGVAMYPAHATTAAALLRRADEALYAAKDGGRNRVLASGRHERAAIESQ